MGACMKPNLAVGGVVWCPVLSARLLATCMHGNSWYAKVFLGKYATKWCFMGY
jgi:hypothetical protein